MAISRNRVVARWLQLRAWGTRCRPKDFEKGLRANLLATKKKSRITPRQAWDAYVCATSRRSFADAGWLVQFGIYAWSGGPRKFEFSLVRQFRTLQTWNDEYVQLNLNLSHEPTPALAALGDWNQWSFNYASPAEFFRACERVPSVGAVLLDQSSGWTWDLACEET